MFRIYLILIVLTNITIFGNDNKLKSVLSQDQNRVIDDYNKIIFKDTVGQFVFDSLYNDLGKFVFSDTANYLIKYFKYNGQDSVRISRTWSSDPHYICKSPTAYLEPQKIYSFVICFAESNSNLKFKKQMGFYFSDGTKATIFVLGSIIVEK